MGYNVINGYREVRVREKGVERIIIQLLEDGKFFTQTTLPENITEERYKSIIQYLNETFEESINNGLIFKDNVKEYDDWVDAIVKKDYKEAISCADKISKIDDDTMRLINMLHETYKSFLISPPTRIKYSEKELMKNIDFVHSCEMGIKNGFIEEEFVRNYLMINLILS